MANILLLLCYRIVDHLGSGQFGTVEKGVWTTFNGQTDVAIKTLNNSSNGDEEVKFLQEAAINGQFHHPNIIMLLGVVTVGEPVSRGLWSWRDGSPTGERCELKGQNYYSY